MNNRVKPCYLLHVRFFRKPKQQNSLFKDKTILITGGTGSLGQALTKRLLEMGPQAIRIFSRNESKQIEMENIFKDDRLRFFLGDVRDLPRLNKAVEDVDFVFLTFLSAFLIPFFALLAISSPMPGMFFRSAADLIL